MYEPYPRYRGQPPQSPVTFCLSQMAYLGMRMVSSVIQSVMNPYSLVPPADGGWDAGYQAGLYAPAYSASSARDFRSAPPFAPAPWPSFQLTVMQPPARTPARVFVSVTPGSDLGNLELLPLHDVNSPDRFIRGSLERGGDRALLLRLQFEERQAGNFYGTVFDKSRRQPCGYVCVGLDGDGPST